MGNWEISADWDRARRTGFQAIAYADVYDSDGTQQGTLDLTGGTITVQEASKVRRTLDLTSSDIDLAPREADDLLAPFGTELHVFAGMQFANTREVVPVGVFAVDTSGRSSWDGPLAIRGFDRGGVLDGARFLQPWNTAAGTAVVTEIANLIAAVLPDVEVFDLTGSDALTRAATWDRDRWGAIQNLAAGIGAEVAFDQAGRAIIQPVPTVADLVDFGEESRSVYSGEEDADLIDVDVALQRAGIYNAVVASSDQETPVVAIAYQATGALRYRAGFQLPRFYNTPVVTTYQGIASAAAKILARSVAFSRKIAPTLVPDYSMDVGSLVTLSLPDGSSATRIASTLTLPLGPGTMTMATRVDAEYEVTDDGSTLE